MALKADALYFSFSSQELLSGLHLTLGDHAKVALTGPNGSGKTTLLKLLAGQLTPDRGQVSGDVFLLEQHVQGNVPASGGEVRIAALREAFASNARALLLDEPTNDLDEDARHWLSDQIRSTTSALLLVSHDPMVLDLVEEIWELRDGRILKHPGGYAEFVQRLDEEETRLQAEVRSLRSQEKKTEAKARELIQSQEKRMSRGKKQGEKSNLPKILRGAKKRQAELTLAKVKGVQEERNEEIQSRMKAAQERLRTISLFEWDSAVTRPPLGKRLLEVKDARLPQYRRGASFSMTGASRIHLKGKNGSGKSTLLRALAGESEALERVEGDFYLAKPFQLFDQALSRYTSESSLWEWFHERTELEISMARSILGRLGFEQEEQLRPVSALSGGERVRIEIALALHAHEPPQILLLDEPTNHLDIESRRILQHFVEKFEGGLLVVSHDVAFVQALKFDEVVDLDGYR